MSTKKKIRSGTPGLAAAQQQRAVEPAAAEPARTDIGGKLPGDEGEGLFWEQRVAAWLGVARKRIVALRRRALLEGEHWIVHSHGVVYSVAGLQKLRDLLASRGEGPRVAREEPAEMAAPSGPPEKRQVVVAKLFPNPKLMAAKVVPREGETAVQVLVRVRDNRNFIPGMRVAVVHDPRSTSWQFVGRLPRRKGRL